MSIIFGIRKSGDGKVLQKEMESVASATDRFAQDGVRFCLKGRIGMGCQPYYTHDRSRLGIGPASDASENIAVLDGRLDNYLQLCEELDLRVDEAGDSQIILEGYQKWGAECFSHFIGDWSIALWAEEEMTLYLARDHAGTRTLYYELCRGTVIWSTYLESFMISSHSKEISEEYAASYLGSQSLRELTPYHGIRSVKPAHYIAIRGQRAVEIRHWRWFQNSRRTYSTDKEYEEQFLLLFRQAVSRRFTADGMTLAQLSGGMDSSSIVCMADHISRDRAEDAHLLDTLSYYDDGEPNWNERPFFSLVETTRGKTGIHLRVATAERSFTPQILPWMPPLPGMDAFSLRREMSLDSAIGDKEYRCVLSGIGGDEVLGGVPTPYPELADYLMTGDLTRCIRQSISWCLVDRTPLHYMLTGILKNTLALYSPSLVDHKAVPPWIRLPLWKRQIQRESQRSMSVPLERPVVVANELTWWSLMETLPHLFPAFTIRREFRYPFLDKDLVEFLFSIPREQLLRPGRRRHLMRRALRGIVPEAILERRRKAYLIRSPLNALRCGQKDISALFEHARISQFEYVSIPRLKECMQSVVNGRDLRWMPALTRAIAFELWLRERELFTMSNSALSSRERPRSA